MDFWLKQATKQILEMKLISLPSEVLFCIMLEWLEVKYLFRLNSSFSGNSDRKICLDILDISSDSIQLESIPNELWKVTFVGMFCNTERVFITLSIPLDEQYFPFLVEHASKLSFYREDRNLKDHLVPINAVKGPDDFYHLILVQMYSNFPCDLYYGILAFNRPHFADYIYVGNLTLKDSTPLVHGKGHIIFNDRDLNYVGDFHFGDMTVGVRTFSNGDIYSGQFLDCHAHGIGTYSYSDGSVYFGEWVHNVKSGEGKEFYSVPNSEHMETYDGEFLNDKRHGTGLLKFRNGTQYYGDFYNLYD
jgi:hypothetical protein